MIGAAFPLADHDSADGDEWMYGRNSHERHTDSGDWREHIDLKAHRNMLEEVALGLAFLVAQTQPGRVSIDTIEFAVLHGGLFRRRA